jgi:hypothetical protein
VGERTCDRETDEEAPVFRSSVSPEEANPGRACKLTKVKPSYVWLDDNQDVTTFIFDRNGMRRHMKKGQIAMLAVKAEGLKLEGEEADKLQMICKFP